MGGRGNDTYFYRQGGSYVDAYLGVQQVEGDGHDTIFDADGIGEVHYRLLDGSEVTLNGGNKRVEGDNLWGSVDAQGKFDGRFTYQYLPDLKGGTLRINGSEITIEGYTPGKLGIQLSGAGSPGVLPADRRVGTTDSDRLFL